MKTLILSLLVLFSIGCGSTEHKKAKADPLTGVILAEQLMSDYPHFQAVYQAYQPSAEDIAAAKLLIGKSVVVLFGTWCHDSEREVPRLLKLLDDSGVGLEKLSLYGLNYNKQEPNKLHRTYNVNFTPTIILLDGEQELGRVIEKPSLSLAEDLASFLVTE